MAATKKPSNEIKITRLYDAPVDLVWDAWTDPVQTAKWWGPRGFTLTTHSKDLRVGGHWNYTMHGPDGVDYPNNTVYYEVEKHAKLVYDHGANETQPPLFRVTVLFSEQNGKTLMDMTMTLATPEIAEQTRRFIRQAGGNATWDRLAEYLTETSSGRELFVINRSFDAPIDVVFSMWAEPQHLARWLPPTGFNMEFIRPEIKVGGTSFYKMSNDQFTMYGRGHYLAIERPTLLVFTQQFCDENEIVARHPGAPTWPEIWVTTVALCAEGPDQTRVTVTSEVRDPKATAEEKAAFVEERGGMTKGWSGSFDKLEEYLAK